MTNNTCYSTSGLCSPVGECVGAASLPFNSSCTASNNGIYQIDSLPANQTFHGRCTEISSGKLVEEIQVKKKGAKIKYQKVKRNVFVTRCETTGDTSQQGVKNNKPIPKKDTIVDKFGKGALGNQR